LAASGKNPGRKIAPPVISARLNGLVTLDTYTDGSIVAYFDEVAVALGNFSAEAAKVAQGLTKGLSLRSFEAGGNATAREVGVLVERLARRGLLEYRFGHADGGDDQVIIEPQLPDYWPRIPKLAASDTIVLSRFAYLRRRGNEMVLESPRAGALFRIGDPAIATTLAALSSPQKISKLRRQPGFPGTALLALLVDCQILFKPDAAGAEGLRLHEGDDKLVLWDFHDLLFHTHSTQGRQANPLGGLYPYASTMPPPPAVRPRWPGKEIDLHAGVAAATNAPLNNLLRERHSTRDFDDQQPITLAELSQFLESAARVQSNWEMRLDGDSGPMIAYTTRPYPSAGGAYELELYLSVANCAGVARGFYHYDADRHALTPIDVRATEFEALLEAAQFAMDAPGLPQVLITIAARFDRISWKYSSIAYSLILKDVGVLIQTLYLAATEMGLGGCAIGTSDIGLFATMTGIDFHIEGPVGQFAIGRAYNPA
jgi:SagB-type dehydrogenase family enzyme